jgi:hypothetical protein
MTITALTKAAVSESPAGPTVLRIGGNRLTLSRCSELSLPLESNERAAREGVPPPGGLYGQYRAFQEL